MLSNRRINCVIIYIILRIRRSTTNTKTFTVAILLNVILLLKLRNKAIVSNSLK